jgi:hypothetical protein
MAKAILTHFDPAQSEADGKLFNLIAWHKAMLRTIDALSPSDNKFEKTLRHEHQVWLELLAIKPASLKGIAAYAAHVAAYQDLDLLTQDCALAMATIAVALRETLSC